MLPLGVEVACTTLAVSAWYICIVIAITIAHDAETVVIQLMFVAAAATLSNPDVVADTANNNAANDAEAAASKLILKKAIVNPAADDEPGLDFAVTSPL